MKIEIITLLIRLAIAIMTGICIPLFRNWLKTKIDNEKLDQLRKAAETAVYAAEQLMRDRDPDGEERRMYAHSIVSRVAIKLGLSLTDKEIDELIQASVRELNFYTHSEMSIAK